MSKWNPDEISRQFKSTAEQAERDSLDSRGQKEHYNDLVAKSYVYFSLSGKTFLDSRESLVAQLKIMLDSPPSPPLGVSDLERFKMSWNSDIKKLILEYDIQPEVQSKK